MSHGCSTDEFDSPRALPSGAMTHIFRHAAPIALLVLVVACSDEPLDAGDGMVRDAGTTVVADGGGQDRDAGEPAVDAGVARDGGSVRDGGTSTSTVPLGTIDLGTISTGADGRTPPIEFELPADTVSFMVVTEAAPEAFVVVYTLEGPDGPLVTNDESTLTPLERLLLGPFAAQFKSPNRVVQDSGIAAALFPNNPGVSVSGGTYTMRIAGLVPQGQQGQPYVGDIDVEILFRTQVPSSGRLDVSLYFTGAGGIDAASAPTAPLIQDALVDLGEIYATAGITIGAIAYHDVDARFRTIEVALSGGAGPLEEMFEATQGPGLHFFFVDRFESPIPGGAIGGIAGGLPGPPLRPSTLNSGVAVALEPANEDPAVLAHVMAHEGGHWLGLFHTSEITGSEDQHPETPSGEAGNLHLMYPAVGGGTMISPSQARVMRLHAETIAQ
jgi:hypothetical protein